MTSRTVKLVDLLESKTTNPDELARAVELIEQGGGIEACRDLALKLTRDAQGKARALATSGTITRVGRALLCSMADFFINTARRRPRP